MAAGVRKVTLAITNEEYAWAERRAQDAGTSVSAVLSATAREKRLAEEREAKQRKAWAEVVAYVTRGAPLTHEEIAAAERELEVARSARPSPRRASGPKRARLEARRSR
jgi:hypothetical protein